MTLLTKDSWRIDELAKQRKLYNSKRVAAASVFICILLGDHLTSSTIFTCSPLQAVGKCIRIIYLKCQELSTALSLVKGLGLFLHESFRLATILKGLFARAFELGDASVSLRASALLGFVGLFKASLEHGIGIDGLFDGSAWWTERENCVRDFVLRIRVRLVPW